MQKVQRRIGSMRVHWYMPVFDVAALLLFFVVLVVQNLEDGLHRKIWDSTQRILQSVVQKPSMLVSSIAE